MKLIELIIDDEMELSGIDAISIVENPAIEEDFIALKTEQKEYKFAEVDKEKKIIMGAMLVPDKPIYRRDENEGEYYIYFSKDTIRKCMELFFQNGNQSNATFEHMESITGLTMVESWIVEDTQKDKSNLYELNVPVGTWMGTIKVNNDVIWNDFIKTGKVKGFSIEGYFADKAKTPLSKIDDTEDEILAGLDLIEIATLLGYKKKIDLAKISFDYDSTISTAKGTELAKKLIKAGNDIYIISARHLKSGILNKAKELGIPMNRVYATGSNVNKINKIKSLKIVTHYDNNPNVIKELNGIGKLFTNE
jgi:hypothetical protein